MLINTLSNDMGKTLSLIRIDKIIEFCVLFKLDEDIEVHYWKVDSTFSLSCNLTEARVENTVVTFFLLELKKQLHIVSYLWVFFIIYIFGWV